MVAALMMGGLAQRNTQSGSPLGVQAGGGGLMGMLSGLLDQNKDGSVLDDLTGLMGRKFDA